MIRDRLYCPNCQMEEVPVLVKTPWYNCPDCQTISPRAEMLTKRTAKLALAGTSGAGPQDINLGFSSSSMFSQSDPTQIIGSISTAALNIVKGRTYVVCYGSRLAGDKNTPPSLACAIIASFTKIHDAGTNLGQYGGQWYGVGTTTGSVIVSAVFNSTSPTAAQISVVEITGTNVNLDKSSIATGTSTTPDSGLTATRSTTRQVLVPMITNSLRLSLYGTTYNTPPPYSIIGGDGTDTGTNDCTTEIAELLYTANAAAVKVSATTPTSVEWVCGIVTFKNG
tara:strand:+ start:87 stop:929 length:843 start_codon:yes stop_codon:yes gene_type:complete